MDLVLMDLQMSGTDGIEACRRIKALPAWGNLPVIMVTSSAEAADLKASRMEAHGVKGGIQVTEATHTRLQDEYEFAERGVIPVKGKGAMRTYMLLGRRKPVSEPGGSPAGADSEAVLSNP